MSATTAELPQRAWVPLEVPAAVLDITRTSVYERIRSGAIPGRKIGGSWFVPIWWVEELVESGMSAPSEKLAA